MELEPANYPGHENLGPTQINVSHPQACIHVKHVVHSKHLIIASNKFILLNILSHLFDSCSL